MNRKRLLFALALALAGAGAPVTAQERAQTPAFVIELVDALSTDRGGPVRARPVAAPAAARLAAGDTISGDATVERMPDGLRRMTIRWTAVRPASGQPRRLVPPGETIVRTAEPSVAAGTRLRVAWSAGTGLGAREIDLPAGPNAEQQAILKRAREAGRLAPPGTGAVVTLDMLFGDKPNPLAPSGR